MALWDILRGKAPNLGKRMLPLVSFYGNSFADLFTTKREKKNLEEYRGWVYACVRAISEEVGAIDLKLMKDDDEVEEHPAMALLDYVNPFMTRFDLFMQTQSYLELDGNAFWYLTFDGQRQPQAIWPLRPDHIKVVPSKEKYIKEYIYSIGNEKFVLPPEAIVHIKEFNPTDPYRGMGTVDAAFAAVHTDNHAKSWNAAFFKNNALPGVVLEVDGMLSPEDESRIKRSWTDAYRGSDKAHKMAIMQGGMKIHTLQANAKDMDFVELRRFNRDEILSLFRVPKTAIGISEDVNRANAEATDYTFALRTIKPKMRKIADTLTEIFLTRFENSDGLHFTFADPVPDNRELTLQEYQNGLLNGWLSVNDVRRREGLPEIEGGDTVNVPFNSLPLGEPVKRAKTPENGTQSQIKDVAKLLTDPLRKIMEAEEFEKRGEVVHKALIFRGDEMEEKFADRMDKFFSGQKKRILAEVKKKVKPKKGVKAKVPNFMDLDSEKEELIKALGPLFDAIALEEGQAALDQVLPSEVYEEHSRRLAHILAQKTSKFAGSVTNTTSKQIRAQIAAGLAKGESIDEIADRISASHAFARTRSEKIARSEVIRTQNLAREEVWRDSGVVKGKIWYTAQDERVEAICAAMHGKLVSLDEPYFKQGETRRFTHPTTGATVTHTFDYETVRQPPAHVNCRCTTLAATVSPKEAKPGEVKETTREDLGKLYYKVNQTLKAYGQGEKQSTGDGKGAA